jgi:hypothetical protein
MLYASAPGQAGLPSATASYLSTNANSITTLVVIGGVAAVPAAVADAAKAEAQKTSLAALQPMSVAITQVPSAANGNVGLLEVTFAGGAIAPGTPAPTSLAHSQRQRHLKSTSMRCVLLQTRATSRKYFP